MSRKMVMTMVSILVSMPEATCKLPLLNCNIIKPLPILHKYTHPGDIIIAGIISQVYTFSSPILFDRHPSNELQDEVM